MSSSTPFGADSYVGQVGPSRASADAIAPFITELLQPRSVVDVGCGAGAWLASFGALGAADLVGLEGGHPDPSALQVPPDQIRQVNLESEFDLGRRFDLAVSVEVAEHLPASAAVTFISSLSAMSDAILFSAAAPGQGGAWHVNEQWPHYWFSLFQDHGFQCFDIIRTKYWDDNRVEWWYRQNLLLFARDAVADRLRDRGFLPAPPLALAHPRFVQMVLLELERDRGVRESSSILGRALLRSASRVVRRESTSQS